MGGLFKIGVYNCILLIIIIDIGINYMINFNFELYIFYFKIQFEDLKKYDIFIFYCFQLSVV